MTHSSTPIVRPEDLRTPQQLLAEAHALITGALLQPHRPERVQGWRRAYAAYVASQVDDSTSWTPPRQDVHISGGDRPGGFRFTVGSHDLSRLLVSREGPRLDNPDEQAPRVLWVPLIVDGVDDPDGMIRTGSPDSDQPAA